MFFYGLLALLKVFLCVPKNLPAQFKFVCRKNYHSKCVVCNLSYVNG